VMQELETWPDERLAAHAQAGHLEAFDELVRRHHARVWRFLYACCRDSHTAADLTQETFVTAYRQLSRFDPGRAWVPWLFTLARNKWRDFLRRRPPAADELSDSLPDLHRTPDEQTARQELWSDLWSWAARHLPPKQFQVLWHRYHEDLPCGEIASTLGLTEIHVKVLLFRARQALARAWKTRAAPGSQSREVPWTATDRAWPVSTTAQTAGATPAKPDPNP